jgi:Tfp pilus assembly protein PilF
MSKIPNKKKKFIERNFERLSVEELAQKTGLKPYAIRSLTEHYKVKAASNNRHFLKNSVADKSLLSKQSMQVIGACALFIFLLTCLIYTPALKNDFVWDDIVYVHENSLIHSLNIHSLYGMLTSFIAGNWHPLTCLSHAIDYAFWGFNPFGHHLTNILFHGLNTLLVFLLVIQLMSRIKACKGILSPSHPPFSRAVTISIVASTTALLFGLHPLHVESVAWVSERKDLLCTFFVLLSILFYVSYTSSVAKRHRLIWFTTSLFLFTCALMSKPMAVTLPGILLLLDIYPLKRNVSLSKNLFALLEKIPFFTLSIISSVITIIAQHSVGAIGQLGQYPLDARLLNASRSLLFYLEKMIVPYKLVPFYPFPEHIHWLDSQYLLSGILLLSITAWCVWMAKQGKYLFLITWSYYILTLLPVIGIIQVGMQAAADRYTYLPSLSIFLLLGIGVAWAFERVALVKHMIMLRGFLSIVICSIVFFIAQLTVKQIKIWQNPESVWSYVISVFPQENSFPHYNLGNVYAQKGMLDEAISAYKQALVIRPRYAEVHHNLGLAYQNKGMLDEAISAYKRTLSISPRYAGAYNNLGNTYVQKGMLDEAIAAYKKALAIKPSSSSAYNNLGNTYSKKGSWDKAISEYKKAIAINPDYANAHSNLSIAYYSKGNYRLALFHCDKAVALGGSINPKLLESLKPFR